eukprot:Opistho-2@35606
MEALFVILLTSTITMGVPYLWSCTDVTNLVKQANPEYATMIHEGAVLEDVCIMEGVYNFVSTHGNIVNGTYTEVLLEDIGLKQFMCSSTQYNEMASLFHVPGHSSINNLLKRDSFYMFSGGTLATFGILYFFLALITSGIAIPGGLLIPMLLIGATLGRGIGTFVNQFIKKPLNQTLIDPGSWALLGAAGFWTGSARVTVTVAAIIFEITGDIRYLPAIAIVVCFSKLVADRLDHGLYHMMLDAKRLPFLPDEPDHAMERLAVWDVMATQVVCLEVLEKASHIRTILEDTTHNGFPIVTYGPGPEHKNKLVGLVLRSQLNAILNMTRDFVEENVVNLSGHMHATPTVVVADAKVIQAYRQFRNLNLRHMCVVTSEFEVIGMLTRKDFLFHYRTRSLSASSSMASLHDGGRRDSTPLLDDQDLTGHEGSLAGNVAANTFANASFVTGYPSGDGDDGTSLKSEDDGVLAGVGTTGTDAFEMRNFSTFVGGGGSTGDRRAVGAGSRLSARSSDNTYGDHSDDDDNDERSLIR